MVYLFIDIFIEHSKKKLQLLLKHKYCFGSLINIIDGCGCEDGGNLRYF